MTSAGGWQRILEPVAALSTNLLGRIGVVLVTSAVVLWLLLLPVSGRSNPYVGIPLFILLPAGFMLGLALIPIGRYLDKKRRKHRLPPSLARFGVFIAVTTLINVVVASHLSYQAVGYMESNEFCGTACHSVMKPQYGAWKIANHAKVKCVACHVGEGAAAFVSAKMAGVHQLVAITTNSYQRPVHADFADRNGNEMCERCHAGERTSSEKLVIIDKFAEDEQNTRAHTVLQMRDAIHKAHLGGTVRFTSTDRKRDRIGRLEYSKHGAHTVTYEQAGVLKDGGFTRTMDCLDCHNRPAHTFEAPGAAVDNALAAGDLDPKTPSIKKRAVEVLTAEYKSQDEARTAIQRTFGNTRAAQVLTAIYDRNVFPDLRVTWGSYPSLLGHENDGGCFRCHNDSMKTQAGKALGQDCSTCHEMVAMDENDPKILKDLGIQH